MNEPAFDFVGAIAEHSAGFAAAADGNLDAEVEHCPGWNVADLVQHLTETHWFWATIVEGRLSAPPEEGARPAPADRTELLATFRVGADRLVRVLRDADQQAAVYTWAPSQHDVAFVTRHQVQEAAVHHWDAVHAAGGSLAIPTQVAVDAVDEFLTFSVSSDADPAEPARPPLDGAFVLRCSDAEASWAITDGAIPGTIAFERDVPSDAPALDATGSALLLWLYGRVRLDTGNVPVRLTERFRALLFTD